MALTESCLGGTRAPVKVPLLKEKILGLHEEACGLLGEIRGIAAQLNIPPRTTMGIDEDAKTMAEPSTVAERTLIICQISEIFEDMNQYLKRIRTEVDEI